MTVYTVQVQGETNTFVELDVAAQGGVLTISAGSLRHQGVEYALAEDTIELVPGLRSLMLRVWLMLDDTGQLVVAEEWYDYETLEGMVSREAFRAQGLSPVYLLSNVRLDPDGTVEISTYHRVEFVPAPLDAEVE